MRLINAEKLEVVYSKPERTDEAYVTGYIDGMHDALEMVDAAPTVDAVPVVRCRECKYSQPWYADKSRCFLWHESGIDVFNDGYCSYGERKENTQ